MLINVVALEMLKAKMPQFSSSAESKGMPGVPQTKVYSASSDEDPYSLSPSGSSGSSGPGPRATDPAAHYGPRTWALGGQEKKKEAGRGRNKKGRKGDAARQGENIYLIFSFFTCLASVQITQ